MPHVIVKMWPGCTEEQKLRLTEMIARDVVTALDKPESSVSVSMEEVDPDEWPEKVYRPDILNAAGRLYRKPGYNPFE